MTTGWRIDLPLREEYVDYLGHVTAAAHVTLLEEGHGRWLAEIMDDQMPSFVLAGLELDYKQEIVTSDGPVTVTVQPVRLGRSSVTVHEALSSHRGLHTVARAVLVRWDRELRRSMAFAAAERAQIVEQLAGDR